MEEITVTIDDSQELIEVTAVDGQESITATTLTVGDMRRDVYDSNGNGIVDMSEDTQLFGGFTLAFLQAFLLSRTNHTGTQLSSTISDFASAVSSLLPSEFTEVVTESGATRTLSASDNGKIIRYTNVGGCVVTIPDTLSEGFTCLHAQKDSTQVSFITSGSMVLVNADSHTMTAKQHAIACTLVEATNIVNLNGYTA